MTVEVATKASFESTPGQFTVVLLYYSSLELGGLSGSWVQQYKLCVTTKATYSQHPTHFSIGIESTNSPALQTMPRANVYGALTACNVVF